MSAEELRISWKICSLEEDAKVSQPSLGAGVKRGWRARLHDPRRDTLLVLIVDIGSHHGVGLSRPGLTVREDCSVVALHNVWREGWSGQLGRRV
jgi:hypothetical protein